MIATIDAQKTTLAEAEEFKKSAGSHHVVLEEKIRNLEGAVKFRDEAVESMKTVWRAEAKELAENREAMETSKSQAQIA